MQKHFSIFLACLIMAFTLQLGIASHYCGGKLAQTKMVYGYGKASCGMGCNITPVNPIQQEPIFQKLSCCQDFIFTVAVDEYQSVSQKLLIETPTIVSTALKLFNSSYFFVANTAYSSIPPPHTSEVLLPFIQVFLI